MSLQSRPRLSTPGSIAAASENGKHLDIVTPWCVLVLKVSSHVKQQEALIALRDIEDVTALGTSGDEDLFVVVDCPDRRMRETIKKFVSVLDPRSEVVYILPRQLPSNDGGGAA